VTIIEMPQSYHCGSFCRAIFLSPSGTLDIRYGQ
jgi:hypothetical protein